MDDRALGVKEGMDIALELMESGQGIAGMERLVLHLDDTRKTISAAAWRMFARWAITHPIALYVHADPFTYRAFTKPRGHAGDAVMMDYIYGFDMPEPAAEARDISRFMTGDGCSPKAVRYRRHVPAETQGLLTVTAIDQDEASLEVIARDYSTLGARPVSTTT